MDDGYRLIADYGAIGNLATVALVSRTGSIDWCCLPSFDSPSVFGAILDSRRGGRFRVSTGSGIGEQRYVAATNVLETTFEAPNGRLVVTDFMPLSGNIEGRGKPVTAPEVHRLLHVEGGPVEVDIEWAPRPDYARARTDIARRRSGFIATSGEHRIALDVNGSHNGLKIVDSDDGPVVRGRLSVPPGMEVALVTGLGGSGSGRDPDASRRALEQTLDAWRGWVYKERGWGSRDGPEDRSWAKPYDDLVLRSELALKLMSFAETGAIVAAATTSLPESIGGVRNWDYRYTWIRDASLTVQALHAVGHDAEAIDFIEWAERAAEQKVRSGWNLQIMYGIRGETDLTELELMHLEGYRHSRPVRIGNGAAGQRQLDIHGELLDGAYELAREGHELSPELLPFLVSVADSACGAVGEQDDGIWEMRGRPAQYTYSQLMVWVGLDRAIQLARRYGLGDGNVDRWRRQRRRARELILRHGYNAEIGAFTQTFGGDALDATSLLIPLHELLPFDDPRVQGTIDRTLERLVENDLVYRYRVDDGLPGEEGAFVLCTFWLVEALALSGRLDEAHRVFDSVVGRVNHVGLFSEQIDPRSGEFLGNVPQAFSHLGLISGAIYLAHAAGRPTPVPAPVGSREHREAVRRIRAAP